MQKTTLPEGFTASSSAEFEIRFDFLSRLRVLFGRPARVRQEMYFKRSPGECEIGNVRLEVAPIGGSLPQE